MTNTDTNIQSENEIVTNKENTDIVTDMPVDTETIADNTSNITPETTENTINNNNTVTEDNIPTSDTVVAKSLNKGKKKSFSRGRPQRSPREKAEFDQKAIDVARVTRVTSGGRRFSLRISMIIGDRNGRVGLGTGKGLDTQLAMEKAFKDARKNLIKLPIDNKRSIPYEIEAKYDSAKIWISPNNSKGLIAGSSARTILNLAGLQNVTAKFHGGTKNKLNNARVTMKALSKLAIKGK